MLIKLLFPTGSKIVFRLAIVCLPPVLHIIPSRIMFRSLLALSTIDGPVECVQLIVDEKSAFHEVEAHNQLSQLDIGPNALLDVGEALEAPGVALSEIEGFAPVNLTGYVEDFVAEHNK